MLGHKQELPSRENVSMHTEHTLAESHVSQYFILHVTHVADDPVPETVVFAGHVQLLFTT